MTASSDGREPFELTPKQKEARALLGGPATHNLLYGGSRSGKTFLICYANAVRALKASGSRHVIARLHNIDVRQSVLQDTWPKMMRLAFPTIEWTPNRVDQYVELSNGSQVWFAGLDDKERLDKILGKEFATISINEASQVSYQAAEILRTRLAQAVDSDTTREPLALKAYYDLNPVGRAHWTYREFHQGVKPNGEEVADPADFAYLVMNPADNPHLPAAYLKQLEGLSSRQRKRFLEGEYLADVPGALWTSAMIEKHRIPRIRLDELDRIVIGVDPATSAGEGSNETGIVVAGLKGTGQEARGYVLHDASGIYTPSGWARRVIELLDLFGADRIVAEGNQGGAMVEQTIRSERASAPVKIVYASRGKDARAEPVSALYEVGRVHHVGPLRDREGFSGLEDQMTSWVPGEGESPDRLDALVWAITELMLRTGAMETVEVRLG